MSLYGACSLTTDPEVFDLASTNGDGYTVPPSGGEPVVMAARTWGQGRVVVIGDLDLWEDSRLGEYDNLQLALNAFALVGDANGDGSVDDQDVYLAVDVVLEEPGFTLGAYPHADVNWDGAGDVLDVVAIVNAR